MRKKQIIENVLGKRLKLYGFAYDYYTHGRWQYKRVLETQVEQYVVVYRPHADNSLRLELSTSVQGGSVHTRDLSDDPKYANPFVSYADDDEFASILEAFGDFVIEYGLKKLDEISVPLFFFKPDEQMYRDLFDNNVKLADDFARKNSIDRDEPLNASIAIIESIITQKDVEKRFDDESKLMLLELVAFFGNAIIREYGGQWEWENNYKRCYIRYVNNEKWHRWDFLKWFTFAWEESDFERIAHILKKITDARRR